MLIVLCMLVGMGQAPLPVERPTCAGAKPGLQGLTLVRQGRMSLPTWGASLVTPGFSDDCVSGIVCSRC